MSAPLSPEDQALAACLDARDAVHKARRIVEKVKAFAPGLYQLLTEIEDSNTVAINIQLELRRAETQAAQKVAA